MTAIYGAPDSISALSVCVQAHTRYAQKRGVLPTKIEIRVDERPDLFDAYQLSMCAHYADAPLTSWAYCCWPA